MVCDGSESACCKVCCPACAVWGHEGCGATCCMACCFGAIYTRMFWKPKYLAVEKGGLGEQKKMK